MFNNSNCYGGHAFRTLCEYELEVQTRKNDIGRVLRNEMRELRNDLRQLQSQLDRMEDMLTEIVNQV